MFLSFFYLYRPALLQLLQLKNALDQLATMFLGADLLADPYGYVATAWRAPWLYPLLTLLNWLVLGLSFSSWLLTGRALLRRDPLPPHLLLLWLLYTAFALLLAVSVLVDLSGALSPNLQVRLFPHFMVVAIPLAAGVLSRWARRLAQSKSRWPMALAAALPVAVLLLSGASLLKATGEPLLNNRWGFYTAPEMQAIVWVEDHLQNTSVWIGMDRRLGAITEEQDSWRGRSLTAITDEPAAGVRDLLVSESMAAAAARQSLPLPDLLPHLCVYDSGTVQLYHARARTPYQR